MSTYYPGILDTTPAALGGPTFVGAGTGSGGTDPLVALTPVAPAGLLDLDILIGHVAVRSDMPGMSCSEPGGWNLRFNDVTPAAHYVRQFIFTRQYTGFAMPTFTWGHDVGALSLAARARFYAVRGASTTLDAQSLVAAATGVNSVSIPTITTISANTLVIALMSVINNFAWASATGETGADYTLPVTGFTGGGGNCGIHIQAAPKAAAGTLSGGAATIAGTPNWVCRAISFQPG